MPLPVAIARSHYAVALCLLLGAALAVCLWLAQQRIAAPALSDYHLYECRTLHTGRTAHTESPAESRPVFRMLSVTSLFARDIAESLCASPIIARYYRSVQISWKPRTQLTAEALLNEQYDLIWSRENTLRGLVPEFTSYYDTLLRIRHYQVYWFSRGEKPALTAEYLKGRRLGLLNDRLSHTHYLLPLESLKRAGVSIADQQLVYFDDAMSLFAAFQSGEIDLISGGLWLEQDLDMPLQRTLISDNAIAAGLFIRKQRAQEVDCEIIRAMQALENFFADGSEMDLEGHHCAVQ